MNDQVNDQIHLSRKERSTLKQSRTRSVKIKHCEKLLRLHLVEQDIELVPGYRGNLLDTCHITDEGQDYLAYYHDMRRTRWIENAWIPIIVSFATTVATNYIIPKLPMLIEWISNTFSKIFSSGPPSFP